MCFDILWVKGTDGSVLLSKGEMSLAAKGAKILVLAVEQQIFSNLNCRRIGMMEFCIGVGGNAAEIQVFAV